MKHLLRGYGAALASAALVGMFTVLNKWLLVESVPALTAGAWTYLAAGLALLPWAVRAGRIHFRRPLIVVLWLLAGSVVGPSLYFLGLQLTSGVQGVLMINMEAVFTAFLAFVIFRERVTVNTLLASLAIIAGGIWLSWPAEGGSLLAGGTLGSILISLGYLGWGTENNLGRLLSEQVAPVSLVCLKALVAGVVMAIISALTGNSLLVPARVIPGIVASGALSLGLSLLLFYSAMRHIGAGRTGLISSSSAFWGVVGAMLLLGESLNGRVIGGGLMMLLGLIGFAIESRRADQAADGADNTTA